MTDHHTPIATYLRASAPPVEFPASGLSDTRPPGTLTSGLLWPSWTVIRLTRMDGTPWLWNTMEPQYQWRWLTERVAEELNCDYGDLDIAETDDGDLLTVKGEPVGRLGR